MYKEDVEVGNKYRDAYRDGIEGFIDRLVKESARKRRDFAQEILKNPELYREKFTEMLGAPLAEKGRGGVPSVKKTFVAKNGEVSIYRMQIDVFDIPFYGILFVKEDNKKRPFAIVQHGGLGSPEVCGNLLEIGSENYNDIVNRVLKYDVNVFAPQLLLWRKEFSRDAGSTKEAYTDTMRHRIDNRLKQFGSSVTALEIYCLMRAIDYFEQQPYVDKSKIGMLGMSYGGFYTLYTTAAEKRIKCCLSCAFFNDRIKYNWMDWVWFNSGNTFTDIETALLIYPRKLYLCVGKADELFDIRSATETWETLKAVMPDDFAHFEQFDGIHEFLKEDDTSLKMFIHDLCEDDA